MAKTAEVLENMSDEHGLANQKISIRENEVKEKITVPRSIELARLAYRKLSTRQVFNPERAWLTSLEGTSLYCMPSYVLGFKTISVKTARFNPNNPDQSLPSVIATVHVYDASTGQEVAEIEAENLTMLRTAASSAVAADRLSRRDSFRLGIFGTGKQAEAHIPALRHVRPIKEIRVYSRDQVTREAFARKTTRAYKTAVEAAGSPEEIVENSDIIVTATNSKVPLFPGELVRPRSLIIAVGAALPDAREVDTALVKRSSLLVVDFKQQALKTYGDILIPLKEGAIKESSLKEIGDLLLSPVLQDKPFTSDRISLFKSGGVAVLDAVFSEYLLSPWPIEETSGNPRDWDLLG